MEETQKFGARLKELRIQAGLTQRELAEKANIDYTYLNKIENGVMPAPSEKVILRLAEALNADKDELITLAGRIPSDIAQMLKNRETLQLLRSDHNQKKAREHRHAERTAHPSRGSNILTYVTKTHKSFSRVIAAVILAVLVGTLLWFASPVTDTAIAANNQGLTYNNNEEYQKAIVSFDKAIELDPGLAIAYSNRGWAYIELGQYEQALTDCNKAIDLDPNLALAYSNRGLAYIKLAQYEQAITDCNKAIELDPNLALAYSNRGLIYIELEQYEQAIADFDQAVKLDPNLQ